MKNNIRDHCKVFYKYFDKIMVITDLWMGKIGPKMGQNTHFSPLFLKNDNILKEETRN